VARHERPGAGIANPGRSCRLPRCWSAGGYRGQVPHPANTITFGAARGYISLEEIQRRAIVGQLLPAWRARYERQRSRRPGRKRGHTARFGWRPGHGAATAAVAHVLLILGKGVQAVAPAIDQELAQAAAAAHRDRRHHHHGRRRCRCLRRCRPRRGCGSRRRAGCARRRAAARGGCAATGWRGVGATTRTCRGRAWRRGNGGRCGRRSRSSAAAARREQGSRSQAGQCQRRWPAKHARLG